VLGLHDCFYCSSGGYHPVTISGVVMVNDLLDGIVDLSVDTVDIGY